CFPKSSVGQPEFFVGAISAQVIDNVIARDQVQQRAAAAEDWLKEPDLQAALAQARGFGGLFTPLDSDDPMRDAQRSGPEAAIGYLATEIGRSDAADAWAEMSRQVLRNNDSRDGAGTAALLAINAYLRAENDETAAQALRTLATAWEIADRGRDALSALRLAARLSDSPVIAEALEKSEARNGFRVTEDNVQANSLTPEICATFSQALSDSVDYAPFVRMQDNGLTVKARGDQLCIGGLTHGQQAAMTLRRGLPSDTGDMLARDVEIKGYIRDRAPTVRFPGRSYVLPARGDQGLAMETVNLETVDLQLMQISDRNLIGAMQDDLFARPLDAWAARKLNDTRATQVWQGTTTVPGAGGAAMNKELTTRLAIPEQAGPLEPGIYVLQATVPGQSSDETGVAAQWFVISDLGISTLLGADGLTVVVRGLADAGPKPDTEVALLSRSNAVLATVTTDDEGVARFDAGITRGTGAAAPALVMASQSNGTGADRQTTDMAFLSLSDPEFDLSDRGVEGMPPSPPIDVFLTLDRGAYRAGEVMNATVLSRDARVQALDDLPLTAIL
ncbi:MAG: alpha-2-macroglobulin, partial [Paracoccus sp. (in: a-proteobacteria)]|nr:alpha-2-macroglobulin [Paracoccus sp. (in: a-proteobacteria)]